MSADLPDRVPSPLVAGLRCRCPQCGDGQLFKGAWTLDLKPQCDRCGLDYTFVDSGDGPAVFAIFLLGFVMLGGALWAQFTFDPPVWLLLAVFAPLTLGLAFGLLRPMKAWMIAMQHRHRAAEGRTKGR